MNYLLKSSIVLILGAFSYPVYANSIEVGVGRTFSRSESEGNALNLSYIKKWGSLPVEYSVGFIGGGDADKASKGKNIGYVSIGPRYYWNNFLIGFGGALVSRTNDRLSSAFNFKSQIGYQYKSVFIKAEHLSNAGMSGKNNGDNIFTIGYKKDFD